MKKNIMITLLSVAVICSNAFAQKPESKKVQSKPGVVRDETKTKTAAPQAESLESTGTTASQEPGMQAWMEYMAPGKMHNMLAKSTGKWKEEITMWMTPGAPPTTTSAICANSMIMGNRYQQSTHSSIMNGMPFEGTGIVGYDNAKKIFVTTWIDNMGTGIMYLEGPWDAGNNSIHLKGNCVDPMTGKEMMVREEFKIIDDNHQQMEMYMTQNGKETKTMEIKFTRM